MHAPHWAISAGHQLLGGVGISQAPDLESRFVCDQQYRAASKGASPALPALPFQDIKGHRSDHLPIRAAAGQRVHTSDSGFGKKSSSC